MTFGEIWDGVRTVLDFIKHSSTALALIGVGGGGLTGAYLARRRYKQGAFRARLEVIGVEPTPDGIEFSTHGRQRALSEVVALPQLEKAIVAGTKLQSADGILRLQHGRDQRLMMEVLEDDITGNDPTANADAIAERPVNRTHVAFCPTYYMENDDLAMIRVYVGKAEFIAKFREPGFAQLQKAAKPRFKARIPLLTAIAAEEVSDRSKSGDTAAVWHTTLKTAKATDVAEARIRAA